MSTQSLIQQLYDTVGQNAVLTERKHTASYCKGFRYGNGEAFAVILPKTLLEFWLACQLCVAADTIILIQAANTGVTGGSTPNGNYDREIVIINTMHINSIHPINNGQQVIAFAGSRLYELEEMLSKYNREPHSVIGSSCIGASVIGGVCNNSGGALIHRGPAYTEMALYAQIDKSGKLHLINNLGLDLGNSPETILNNLDNHHYDDSDVLPSEKLTSDNEYQVRIREIDADTPSRFNQDPRRLFQASGCAGKLIVFAVRLDSFEKPKKQQTFYIGVNKTSTLTQIRRHILSTFTHLPVSGEYLHKDYYDICEKYGKDSFLIIKKIGSHTMPKLFRLKGRIDNYAKKSPFLPNALSDKFMQLVSKILPKHLPQKMSEYRKRFNHYLILTMIDDGIEEANQYLSEFFAKNAGDFFACTDNEGQAAMLHRFVAAGAAGRYHAINADKLGELMSLDIALRRNETQWFEQLPPELDKLFDQKLYCGHFFCHVMHQDYVLKKGVNATEVKAKLLKIYDARGAEYPAEHNVGTQYKAKSVLVDFYRQNDPTNSLNPGIGKTTKKKHWST